MIFIVLSFLFCAGVFVRGWLKRKREHAPRASSTVPGTAKDDGFSFSFDDSGDDGETGGGSSGGSSSSSADYDSGGTSGDGGPSSDG
jgi:hypothetical protein